MHEAHAIVPNVGRTALLLVDGRLPVVRTERWRLSDVLAALAAEVDVRAPFLRMVRRTAADDPVVALLELDASPTGQGSWLSLSDVDPAVVAPTFTDGFEEWLAEQRGAPVPAARPPWARSGWLRDARAWVAEHATVAGEPELVRHWGLSAVYRFRTRDRPLYLKAAFSLFRHEPAVTALVARYRPRDVPELVAVDSGQALLLMHELPGQEMRGLERQPWARAAATAAAIHVALAGRRDEILATGAPDRGLATLRASAQTLAGLDGDAVARMRAACDELESLRLPETLVHGDLHHGNINVDGDRVVVFDWSDGCLAHPLLDLHALFAFADPAVRPDALRAYADEWTSLADPEGVLAAARVAEPLAYLHQAVSYRALADASEVVERSWFEQERRAWTERALAALQQLSY